MSESIAPTKTAAKVKDLTGFAGHASLYKLDPPLALTDWTGHPAGETEYVIVSATSAYTVETYIFPATPDGKVADWGELHGSYQGGTDHAEALSGAGYTVS